LQLILEADGVEYNSCDWGLAAFALGATFPTENCTRAYASVFRASARASTCRSLPGLPSSALTRKTMKPPCALMRSEPRPGCSGGLDNRPPHYRI